MGTLKQNIQCALCHQPGDTCVGRGPHVNVSDYYTNSTCGAYDILWPPNDRENTEGTLLVLWSTKHWLAFTRQATQILRTRPDEFTEVMLPPLHDWGRNCSNCPSDTKRTLLVFMTIYTMGGGVLPFDGFLPLDGVVPLGDATLKNLSSPILVMILISSHSTIKLADSLPNIKLWQINYNYIQKMFKNQMLTSAYFYDA